MEKKNVILLTVIAVATLLITVIGATFAYYAAQIEGTPTQVTIHAADGLGITFNDGETLTASNIIPGWTSETQKTVTVSNNSNYEMEYKITWLAVTNDINDKENLKYSAQVSAGWIAQDKHPHEGGNTSVSQIAATATPTKAGDEFATQKIKPGEEITYKITLNYVDTNSEQGDPTSSQTFSGTLEIKDENVKVVSTDPVLPTE